MKAEDTVMDYYPTWIKMDEEFIRYEDKCIMPLLKHQAEITWDIAFNEGKEQGISDSKITPGTHRRNKVMNRQDITREKITFEQAEDIKLGWCKNCQACDIKQTGHFTWICHNCDTEFYVR